MAAHFPQGDASPSPPPIQKTRERILDAAIEVFSEKGFQASRVSDIARAAGVSHGLVYHYFQSKDEVLLTIFRDRWARFLELARQRLDPDRRAAQKLRSVVGFVIDSYASHPELMRLLLRDLGASSAIQERYRVDAFAEGIALIEHIVREGQAGGEFRPEIDPSLAARIFYGGLAEVLADWSRRRVGPEELGDREAWKSTLAAILMEGIVRRPDGEGIGGEEGSGE